MDKHIKAGKGSIMGKPEQLNPQPSESDFQIYGWKDQESEKGVCG